MSTFLVLASINSNPKVRTMNHDFRQKEQLNPPSQDSCYKYIACAFFICCKGKEKLLIVFLSTLMHERDRPSYSARVIALTAA